MSARVRLLSCVYSDVVGKEPGAGEGLVTMSAFVAPDVGLHVHGQGGHAGVELVANSAVLASVCVDLSVSAQVRSTGKPLSTIWTTLALLATEGQVQAV